MKIYTKKGDSGSTQLIGGTRVSKAHVKIESYGTVDELNSFIGLVIAQIPDEADVSLLTEVQNDLFDIGAMLATDWEKSKMKIPEIQQKDVTKLELEIDRLTAMLPELKAFILPGGHKVVADCHVARCVCRRAERRVSQLVEIETVNPLIIQYLNRLSDYLFTLSRKIGKDFDTQEVVWKSR